MERFFLCNVLELNMESDMQCPECGREIEDRNAHCPYCGVEIRNRKRRTFRSHLVIIASLNIVLILILFAAVFTFSRIADRENAALGAVQQHIYRGTPMGEIFRALDGCSWHLSGDRIVSVSGILSQNGYSADVKVDFGVDTDADVYVRALFVNGALQPVSSVRSMLDRLYDMFRAQT